MAHEATLVEILREHNLDITLKPEQTQIIHALCEGKDVFGVLPTGFGKSLTYSLTPLLLDKLHPEIHHTAIVISPLKALMMDQVVALKEHGISAAAIMEDVTVKDIMEMSDVSVLFTSPEAALQSKWRKMLKSEYQHRACLLAFDEAHCISSWGMEFRPTYREVPAVQSLFDVPNLVLTATATHQIQDDIYDVLGLTISKTDVIAALPDRPNIFLQIQPSSENFEVELSWLLQHLQTGVHGKKFLLYVSSINKCGQLYMWIVTALMEKCFVGQPSPETRRVEMFHANTDSESKTRIMQQFVNRDGTVELLISTVAFGMGVNVSNIDMVIHWGLPTSSLRYWQEVGRCARDGRKGFAMCYAYKRSITKCEDGELREIPAGKGCIRYTVLKTFFLDGMDTADLKKLKSFNECTETCEKSCTCRRCQCCINCQKLCSCDKKCTSPHSTFMESGSC